MAPMIRAARKTDFKGVCILLRELVGNSGVIAGEQGRLRFEELVEHPGTTVLVAEEAPQLVSTATLHILPNMTFGGRSYGLIENVVTLQSHWGKGFGRAVMQEAADRAWAADVYKIMLLTGKELGARAFYEKLGYASDEKHGMTLRRAPKRQPATR